MTTSVEKQAELMVEIAISLIFSTDEVNSPENKKTKRNKNIMTQRLIGRKFYSQIAEENNISQSRAAQIVDTGILSFKKMKLKFEDLIDSHKGLKERYLIATTENLSKLDISPNTIRRLNGEGIYTKETLIEKGTKEILKIRNIGKGSILEIETALAKENLRLKE